MTKILLCVMFLCVSCNPIQLRKNATVKRDIPKTDDTHNDQTTVNDEQAITAADEAVSIPAQIAGSYLACFKGTSSNEGQIEYYCSVREKNSQNLVDIYNLGVAVEWTFQGPDVLKAKLTIQPLTNSLDYHVRYLFEGLTATEQQDLVTSGELTVEFAESDIVVATAKAKVSSQTSNTSAKLITCPAGYISIASDPAYQTGNFCVMKYEAKNVSGTPTSQAEGTPWVNIAQTAALTACRSLGPNYDLLSLNEWNTIAAQIASFAPNWSLGIVGSGALQRGHTDSSPAQACPASLNDTLAYVESNCSPINSSGGEDDTASQRRTHALPNGGEIIWDLAGNVYEWINYFNSSDKPTPIGSSWQEYPAVLGTASLAKKDLVPTNAVKSFWDDTWNSIQGIGKYYPGESGSGGAMHRGGDYAQGSNSGIFAAALDGSPTSTHPSIGFRCRMTLP